jgi:hypothetical protein
VLVTKGHPPSHHLTLIGLPLPQRLALPRGKRAYALVTCCQQEDEAKAIWAGWGLEGVHPGSCAALVGAPACHECSQLATHFRPCILPLARIGCETRNGVEVVGGGPWGFVAPRCGRHDLVPVVMLDQKFLQKNSARLGSASLETWWAVALLHCVKSTVLNASFPFSLPCRFCVK